MIHEPTKYRTGEGFPFKCRYHCTCGDYRTKWKTSEEDARKDIEGHCSDKNFKVPTQDEIVKGLQEAYEIGVKAGYDKAMKELAT